MAKQLKIYAVRVCMLVVLMTSLVSVAFAAPQELTVANTADVVKVDPAYITDTASSAVADLIFDRLARYDTDGSIQPNLASSWETSADGLTWTFHLVKGVKFHDGTPFKAEAVKFSIDRIKDPATASPGSGDFKNVKEVKVIDDYTVAFHLNNPSAAFIDTVIMQNEASVVSPTAVKKYGPDFNLNPVGTGPFKYVEWVPDTRVVLAKNADYFRGAPKLDKVIFRPIPEASTQLIELETGGVDMILKVLPNDLPKITGNKDLVLHSTPYYNARYIMINMLKAPFDNLKLRQAISHAIPIESMFKAFLKGVAVPLDSALPSASWAYHSPSTKYDYNPKLAKKLLNEAGWIDTNKDGILDKDGKPFSITFYTTNYYTDGDLIAGVVQQELKKVGIQVEVKMMEWGAYLAAVDGGEHNLCLLGWNQSNGEPATFLGPQFKSHAIGGWANDMFYHDDKIDELLLLGEKTLDKEARKEIYKEFQEKVAKDVPMVPIGSSNRIWASNKHVKGYTHSAATFDLLPVFIEE